MKEGESILEAIHEEDSLDDLDDVEMLDVEEGELVGAQSHGELGQSDTRTSSRANTPIKSKKRRHRNNKKKNKKRKTNLGSDVTDINRFVLDVCRHLKEKKSYLMYTAVGCLGVSALSDLVKELFLGCKVRLRATFLISTITESSTRVDAIQACGGQKTADRQRFRTAGGILWSILKTREPNAYREIMKKGKEFEKQFCQTSKERPLMKKDTSQIPSSVAGDQASGSLSSCSENASTMKSQHKEPNTEKKQASVHERMRVPVTYDDLLTEEPDKPNME